MSAVASSTAAGVCETVIPRALAACTSIWSYPAPLWQIDLSDEGRALMSSASKRPILETESL